MSSFDFNTALSSRENYDGESPEGLEDYFIAVDDQMWAKGELAHAIASGEEPSVNNIVVLNIAAAKYGAGSTAYGIGSPFLGQQSPPSFVSGGQSPVSQQNPVTEMPPPKHTPVMAQPVQPN